MSGKAQRPQRGSHVTSAVSDCLYRQHTQGSYRCEVAATGVPAEKLETSSVNLVY